MSQVFIMSYFKFLFQMPSEEQLFAYLQGQEMHSSTKQEHYKALMTVIHERFLSEIPRTFEEAFPRLASRSGITYFCTLLDQKANQMVTFSLTLFDKCCHELS